MSPRGLVTCFSRGSKGIKALKQHALSSRCYRIATHLSRHNQSDGGRSARSYLTFPLDVTLTMADAGFAGCQEKRTRKRETGHELGKCGSRYRGLTHKDCVGFICGKIVC